MIEASLGNVNHLSKSENLHYSCEPTARQQHRQVNLGRNKVSSGGVLSVCSCLQWDNQYIAKDCGRVRGDPTIENSRCLIVSTYRPYAGAHDLVAIHYFAGWHPNHPSALAIAFALSASPIITIT